MIHDTIILGAGVAGLAAAQGLRETGRRTLVLEKSRGLGGRAATRRWDGQPVDHGAQFFTARSEPFRAQVAVWREQGVCHEWTHGFHRHNGGKLSPPGGESFPRYACREGMSALGRALAASCGAPVERETKIAGISLRGETWIVRAEDGREFPARSLVVTAPPPQGAALLAEAAPAAAGFLAALPMDPCLAVVARFPRRALGWNGIQSDDPEVSWIGHDTSKRPDRHEGSTIVVVHASPGFSRGHYEKSEAEVAGILLAHASRVAGDDLRYPQAVFVQRWRYAQPAAERTGDPAVAFDAPAPLILAGEIFAGGKIEGAWLSGVAAAGMLPRN